MRHLDPSWVARTAVACALFLSASAFGGALPFNGEAGFSPAHAAASQNGNSTESVLNQSVQKGDTLIEMLESAGATRENAATAARALKKVFDARKLRVGQHILIIFDSSQGNAKQLSLFSIQLATNRFVEVVRNADGKYRARRTSQPWSPESDVAEQRREGGVITLEARPGSTIGRTLHALNIQERDIDRATKALGTLFDPRQLRVGQKISILPGAAGSNGKLTLIGLAVHVKSGGVVQAQRGGNGKFSARRLPALALADRIDDDVVRADGNSQPVAGERNKLRVTEGSTLMELLTKQRVSRTEADHAIRALREVFDPRRLRAGQFIYLIVAENNAGAPELQGLSIAISGTRHATVLRGPSGRFTSGLAQAPIDSLADIAPAAKTPSAALDSSAPITEMADLSKPDASAEEAGQSAAAPVNQQPAVAEQPPAAGTTDIETNINALTILVDRGDTLMAILRSEGIDRHEADRAIRALRKYFSPRRLREGQQIILATRADNSGALTLEGFSIKIGKDRHIEVLRSDAKNFTSAKVSEPNFTARTDIARTNRPAGDGKKNGRVQSVSGPGQGQAMKGAMIAAAAPAEQEMVADRAIVWPSENSATGAESALSFPVPLKKQTASDGFTRKAVMIGKGDTLFVALTKAGSAVGDAEAAIAAFRTVHNPRSLQIGQTLTLAFEPMIDEDNAPALRLAEIALDVAPDRDILVARQDDDRFHASEIARDLVRRLEKAEGIIQTSLYDAAMEAGLPISVLMEMVQIFSFDVDFQREIQKGDKFEVLYENLLNDDGETVALGPVLFAALSVSGKMIGLYRHEPENGPVDYFNIKGQSARKALMLTPINGASLSSGYGMRRHPVLGYNKMHRGLDFSAPRGTAIVAAGDGVIERAGRNGSYGNYIRIRHNGTYKTAYAHMKGFARGIRAGKRVRQGQTIGYVGTTGRSTGPHLHYEVLRNGAQMNPRKLKLPTGQKLKGTELAQFEQQVRKIRVLIAEVPNAQKIASR